MFESDTMRSLLGAHFPSIAFSRVRLMDEGGDFANYDVDDMLVVRLPRGAKAARGLAVERELLPRLQPLLPVAIPVFEYAHDPEPRSPYGFAAYRKIRGLSGEAHRPAPADRPRCAERLGRTLSALHAFPLDQARACGVPRRAMPAPDDVLERVVRYAPSIRRDMPEIVVPEVDDYLRAKVTTPGRGAIRDVLLHHDLKGEHFILSERADDIAGIIDWADASIGDPAADFVGAAVWLGMPFVAQVLDHYDGPIDQRLMDRVRFYNHAMRLIHLGMCLGGEWDAPRDLILTQLRWAFSIAE